MSALGVGLPGDASGVSVGDPTRFGRTLLRRPLAVACLLYLLIVIVIAVVAPLLLPGVVHESVGDLLNVDAGPSGAHWLGTDTLGRDVLDRLLVGTQVTMLGVAEALLVATVIGVPTGLAAGYMRGRVDRVATWVIDLGLSIPSLVVVLVVVSVVPHSLLAPMVTLGLLGAPGTARVVRAATLPVRGELYVDAARVSGLSRPYIVTYHVLPRIAGVVIVQAFLFAAGAVGITAGLAYLGVLDQSVPTWGGMVQDGVSVLQQDPWLIWPPGIAIGLTVLAFALLGDSLRDATTEVWSSGPRRRRKVQVHSPHAAQMSDPQGNALLAVEDLTVVFGSRDSPVPVIDSVTFDIHQGETLGIVGESGCGKTMTAMAVLGLLPGTGRIERGTVLYHGRDLTGLSERQLRHIRGREIALVSQEPTVSLTPTFRVGWQLAQLVRHHHGVSRRAARAQAVELLRQVQLPEPEFVARQYVHELSGGMAQRVAIARALAGDPKLLIADEPTTALDVTVQAEILQLLGSLTRDRGMSILLITHDWGVIADLCDRVVVMYAGEVVESAPISEIFDQPLHPYTEALLAATAERSDEGKPLAAIPGNVPKVGEWPEGCHFHPRCRYASDACRSAPILIQRPASERETRCIHYGQLSGLARSEAGIPLDGRYQS